MARRAVGEKAPPEVLEQWVVNHGYAKPTWWNAEAPGDTMIADHFRSMLTFDFGRSDSDDSPILGRIRAGMGPSLSLTLPLFAFGLVFGVGLALVRRVLSRDLHRSHGRGALCVLGMSLSVLLYIIGGQFLIGRLLRWFPISGFDPSPPFDAAFPGAAGPGRARRGARRERALLPDRLRRGDGSRLRSHRAREGLRRRPDHGAPRTPQCDDSDPHARGREYSLPVPGVAVARSHSSAFPASAR